MGNYFVLPDRWHSARPVELYLERGDWEQGNEGVLAVELGGTSKADTLFDRLVNTGDITLDGTLDIKLVDDFLPAIGDTFDVLSYANASGEFGLFTGLNTGEGISFLVHQRPTYLMLEAIATPNTPPAAFDLLTPADGSTLLRQDTIEFQWEEATDADGDPVLYSLHITGPGLDTLLEQISELNYEFVNTGSIDYNTTYNWSVTATDGEDAVEGNTSFSFTTPADNTSGIGNQLRGIEYLKRVYPNPFENTINLDFSNSAERDVTLEIYSMEGQKMADPVNIRLIAGGQSIPVNVDWLPEGVYIIKIASGSEQRVERMVKLHRE